MANYCIVLMKKFKINISDSLSNTPISSENSLSDQEKLEGFFKVINGKCSQIDRIATALYDEGSQTIKTYVSVIKDENPLQFYEVPLKEVPSLHSLKEEGQPRVINDITVLSKIQTVHTQKLLKAGYRSSYTHPMFKNDRFLGFVFYNSYQKGRFSSDIVAWLELFSLLITDLISDGIAAAETMMAAFKSAGNMVHYRDPETGNHLERMSRFSNLIANEMAKEKLANLTEETINRIYKFAPLHDVGKIAIPDEILLKPGKLEPEERKLMETHCERGVEIINNIISTFKLYSVDALPVLRNIVAAHHETLDGKGYPFGLSGKSVPIEARVVAVADIFDALTSARPYKEAWSNERATAKLKELSGTKLDSNCVNTLLKNIDQVIQIQQSFQDTA